MSRPPLLTEVLAPKSPTPIFKGVGKEWFPTFGVSWHVPQVPVKAGSPAPPAATLSLRPATPLIRIGLELNRFWPRAIAARGSGGGREAHASNVLKITGLKAPAGGSKAAPRLELMLMKNG